MTREEAYKLAMRACEETWNEKTCKQIKEALEQQPCEDCISRQAVNDGFKKYDNSSFAYGCMWDYINKLPSVTPKEKIGRWIKYSIPRCGEQHYQCTSCGYYINFGQWGEVYTKQFKYCPSCSARMVEPQESEDKE